MSYRFTPADQTVEDAVRRIATTLLTRATDALSGSAQDAPATVHDVRKAVKKLRGLIRLARPGFKAYAPENAALRDIGQSLAHLRDSDVMRQTLSDLADGTDAFPAMTAALDAHSAAARDPAATHAAVTAARAALTDLAARVPRWRIRGADFSTPAKALAHSHAAARQALARIGPSPVADDLHEWRKRAKDVLYQMQLIEPFWPAAIGLRVRESDRLTELLGQYNDLAVLLDRAAATPLPPDEAMHLSTRAGLRQSQILAKAMPLGQRLSAGEPKAMAALWTDLWHIWRAEGG
jgi:CHAD domain-containing protein